MDNEKLKQIKIKALEEHIPIIMDDTLQEIEKTIKDVKINKILEIGTAVGYSAICFTKFLTENRNNRYNRKRFAKNKTSKTKYKRIRVRKENKYI